MGTGPEKTGNGLGATEVAKSISSRHQAMLRTALQEAQYLFTEPVLVTDEDRLHGLAGIIEKKLSKAGIITAATPAQKKNHIMDFLEKQLEALGPGELKKFGFESGTVRLIHAGEVLNLSMLDERGWVQAIR